MSKIIYTQTKKPHTRSPKYLKDYTPDLNKTICYVCLYMCGLFKMYLIIKRKGD